MIDTATLPDATGHFGSYGGMFVPETLMPNFIELTAEYEKAKNDPAFQAELKYYLRDYVGRPTPLYFAERLTEKLGGAKIYLKREDLLHTGAHKINNAIGQILLARRLGKTRIIAETGAGQHGVATATVCARFGFECVIYMGEVDMERQALNVARMKFLGAKVVPVTAGQRTLKEAVSEALRDWVSNPRTTHYILGSALGAHPFPMIVRDFHRVIGDEARAQVLEKEKRLPDLLVACVGGGSNAIGLFWPFLRDEGVRMLGIEAGGHGIKEGQHAARFQGGKLGVLQGTKTWLLADDDGQIQLTHSVSAGLDYAAVGPEHAFLKEKGRIEYDYATDDEALDAFSKLCRWEGIIPALESSHAIAGIIKEAPKMKPEQIAIVNLSGRGDKDVGQAANFLGTARRATVASSDPMRSMTGYGRGEASNNGSKFSVELNSVNRKQNDVLVSLPRELSELEARVRDVINTGISRGRLTVVVAHHAGSGAAQVALDRVLAKTYYDSMVALQRELGAAGEVSIDSVLRAPGVLRMPEEQLDADEAWPHVESALKSALKELVKMREVEGKHLAKDLIKRLKTLREAVRKIRLQQPNVVRRYRQNLHERIQKAGIDLPIEDDRLLKEVIVFADKCDITEELTRLESHLAQFAHHLRKNEPVGRTLEFMSQEIAREFNTIGAKANDVDISQLVVTCKAELEKIREQLSNIE